MRSHSIRLNDTSKKPDVEDAPKISDFQKRAPRGDARRCTDRPDQAVARDNLDGPPARVIAVARVPQKRTISPPTIRFGGRTTSSSSYDGAIADRLAEQIADRHEHFPVGARELHEGQCLVNPNIEPGVDRQAPVIDFGPGECAC